MGNSVPRHSFKYKVDPDVASTSSNESLPSPRCYRYNMTHGKSRGQHVTPAMVMEMPCDNLQHLCCGVDGTVWVCRRPQILQLGPKGQSMFLLEVKIEICGLAASNKGELVFTDGKNKRLISTRFDDEVITKKVMSTEEWFPIGVCCAENDDIIVGLFLPEEQGRVTRYSVAGETREIIQKDSSGNQLYKFPAFLAENGNGDVVVSDHLKRAVIVVDRWGRYRFTYTAGELNRPDAVPFLPFGICCDSFWNIIVADCCNDCVHLISVNGEFLHLLFDKQCGLYRPVALSMTKDKKLYVGDRNGIKIFKMDGQRISREVCKSSRANSLSSVGTNKPAGGNGLIKPGSEQGLVRTGSASSLEKMTAVGSTPSKPGCYNKAQTLPSVRSKPSESNLKPISAIPNLPENKSTGDATNRKNNPVPSCTTTSSPSSLSQPLSSSNTYVMTSSTASTSQTSALLSSHALAKQLTSLNTSPSQISQSETGKPIPSKNNPSQLNSSIMASKESSIVTQSTVSSNTVTHPTVSSNTVTHSTVSPNTVTDSPASSNTVAHSIVLSNTVTHPTVSSNTVTHSPVLPNTVTLSTGSSNTLTHSTVSKQKESSISSMTTNTNHSIITSKASPQTTRPLPSPSDRTKTTSLTGTTIVSSRENASFASKASSLAMHSSTSSNSLMNAIYSTGTQSASVVLSTAQTNAMSSSVNSNETDKTMLESSNKSSCKTMPISPPIKSTVKSAKANPKPDMAKPTSSSPLKSKSTTVVSFVEPVTSVVLMTSKPSETRDGKNVRLVCNDTLEKGSGCDNGGVNLLQKVESNSRRTEQPQSEKKPINAPGGRTKLKSTLKPSPTTAKQASSKSNEKVGEVHFAKDEEHSAQSKPFERADDKQSSQVPVKTRETAPLKSPSKGGKNYRDSNIIESTRI